VRVLALWQAHAILRLFDGEVHSLIGLLRLLAGVQLFGLCTILSYRMFFCKTQTSFF
jgi:uncharacterized membrane protein